MNCFKKYGHGQTIDPISLLIIAQQLKDDKIEKRKIDTNNSLE